MAIRSGIGAIIGIVMAVVVLIVTLILYPFVTSGVTTASSDPNSANFSSATSLLNLTPLFVVIGILVVALGLAFVAVKTMITGGGKGSGM